MKASKRSLFVCIIFFLYSFAAFPQTHALDSLKAALQVQKEDTLKVKILHGLSFS
jgi:hypothetical protein